MSLGSNFQIYLSVIQDEALDALYHLIPNLRPPSGDPPWQGWRDMKVVTSKVMGLFSSIENWDSPDLIDALGSLDANSVSSKDLENATKAWLLTEIIALAEAIQHANGEEDIFALTFSLSEKLKTLGFIDDANLAKTVRSDEQRAAIKKRWERSNLLREITHDLFKKKSAVTNRYISTSEILELMQNSELLSEAGKIRNVDLSYVGGTKDDSMVFLFSDGTTQSIKTTTVANWRAKFINGTSQ